MKYDGNTKSFLYANSESLTEEQKTFLDQHEAIHYAFDLDLTSPHMIDYLTTVARIFRERGKGPENQVEILRKLIEVIIDSFKEENNKYNETIDYLLRDYLK